MNAPIERRRGRRGRLARFCLVSAMVVLVVGLLSAYFLGPMAGIRLQGKPFFLVAPSPQRYAAVALDAMEQGVTADSEAFRQARAAAERETESAETYEQTWPALQRAVHAAGGEHSAILPPEDQSDEDGSDGDERRTPEVESTPTPAGGWVAWATVPGIANTGPVQEYADALAGGLLARAEDGACGVVVDLRGNSGGDMGPMVAGLSALLPDGEVLWFDGPAASSAVTVSGGAVSGGGTPVTVAQPRKLDLPVAVLVDEETASSGEATMLAFRGLEYSRSFGTPTAGFASANTLIHFPGGMRLMLTVADDRDRTGQRHRDEPVAPDEATGEAAEAGAAAMAWLGERGCR